MENQQTKTIWRYGVQCVGIKKRCRKSDWHSSGSRQGLKETEQAPCREEAVRLARSWIFNNMKTCTKATATITRWTIKDHGVESWEPFTEADNIKIPIEQISYATS